MSLGFEKMIDLISKHVEMSKRFRESGENNTILACLLESLTEFVRDNVRVFSLSDHIKQTLRQVRDCKAMKKSNQVRKSALRTKKSGNVKTRLERRYNKTWCEHVRTRFPKFQCCNVFSIHEIVVASEYYLNQLSKLQEEEEVPFEKTLIGMVESQLRYCLRCCLNDEEEYEEEEEVIEMENHTTTITPTKKNGGTISMISKSGSMFYNEDDLAAVVSRALYIVETKRNTKEKEEYLDACTFLVKLFSEPILYENARSGCGSWGSIRRTIELTKRAGISKHKLLAPFVRLGDMDAFFEWLRSEQEITKQRILAGTNVDSDQKKKKKKRKRKRRSLSGRRKKPSSGLGGFSFPKLRACSKNSYRDDWICSMCMCVLFLVFSYPNNIKHTHTHTGNKVVKTVNVGGEIACDFCGNWYHLPCLGLTPAYALSVDTYKCPNCSDFC